MIRLACIVVAAALLSGCATLAPGATGPSASYVSFDAGAPVEPLIYHRAAGAFSATLDRRSFSPPLRRQPELRVIVVTAADRLRRRALRRARRR